MNIKIYSRNVLFLVLALVSFKVNYGQQQNGDKKQSKQQEIANLITAKNYVFTAQIALPMSGRSINLTTPYDLRVSGDTLVSDLPYFGRAFVAPMNSSEGGIHFKSTNTTYKVQERKKGGWDITILPKNAKDIRQMFLTVTEDGYATLQVTSDERQSISFNGYIQKNKNKAVAASK